MFGSNFMKKLLLFTLMLCSLSLFGASPTFQQTSNMVSMVMSNKTGSVNIKGTTATEALRVTNLTDLAYATLSSTLTVYGNAFHGAASYFNTITSSNTASFLGAISASGAATLNGSATFNGLAVQPQITLPATLHFNGSRQWYVTNLITGSIAVILTNLTADTIYRLVVDSTGGDGTSAVTFSGHTSPGLCDTNGVSTYVILRTGSATNIWLDTRPIVYAAGSGITDTQTSQFLHTFSASGGAGTVTSVALSAPTEFTVSGSPVTTSGTLAFSKATQSANTIYSGPASGSAAAPTFRAPTAADIPTFSPSGYFVVPWSQGLNTFTEGFNAPADAFEQNWNADYLAGGLVNSAVAVDTAHNGVTSLTLDDVITSRVGIRKFSTVNEASFGGGTWYLEWNQKFDSLLTGTPKWCLGFYDTRVDATATYAAYFNYDSGSANWKCITSTGTGANITTNVTATAVSTDWTCMGIKVAANAGTVTFYINGGAVATNTTTIPTGNAQRLGFHFGGHRPASDGSGNQILYMDYLWSAFAPTTFP